MNSNEIRVFLLETLADHRLSRKEKKSVAAQTKGASFDELCVWRSEAFKVAQEGVGPGSGQSALEWINEVNKALLPRLPVTTSEAYFGPGRGPCDRIVGELRSARQGIDICVFTITDNEISKEIGAAHRRGVPVRILTDNDKSEDRGSDIERLASEGISVRMDVTEHHMHHKFAIFDEQTLLSGSYNWTRSAKNFNQENLIATDESGLLQRFREQFEKLWKSARELR